MFGFGAAIGGLLKAPYEEAKKLAMAKEKFATLNLTEAENAKVFGAAQTLAHKQLGSTITENIHLIQDLHTALGDVDHALDLAPLYQQFATAAKIQNHGKSVDGLVMNSIKALEHRGDKVTQNHDAMLAEMAMQSQVYFATNGRVNPNDYFHASQTGKIAYQLADKEFLYGPLAAIIQQKSGPTAGTALMSMNSALIGGHMDNKAKGFLADLGLWTTAVSPIQKQINEALKSMPAAERKELGITNVAALSGGLRGDAADMAAHRPDLFVKNILVPAMQSKFGKNMSNEDMAMLLAKHFNRSTADILGMLITSGAKIDKDTSIINRTKDFRGSYAQYIKSPEGAEVAADAAWRNFLAVFGSVYLPTITKGLLKLASGLDKLAQFVERNPGPVKVLAYALLGLSGAMMFGGTVNLLAASMRGLSLAVGMSGNTGLFGAVAGLANPIGIAVVGLAALAAAAYAFSPFTKSEIDGYKTDGGVKLSAGAQARVDGGELGPNVKTGSQAGGGKGGNVYLDGKKVGWVLDKHIAKTTAGAGNSNTFDPSMGQLPAGMAY